MTPLHRGAVTVYKQAMPQSTDIVSLGLRDLARHLAAGELSSAEVTDAFLARLDDIDAHINPLAHRLHDSARQQAAAADERRARGAPLSPFDGVPLTLKECFDVAGQPTTLGIVAHQRRIAPRDAACVQLLREAGCVFLGRTNLGQAMISYESRNPLFGATSNPYDASRTPGGSSGGEAAAIAAYGSPGGIGTDVGGSIRVPAHFSGICGFKPTLDRISNLGVQTGIPGQEVIRGQAGFLARTTDDVRALCELLSPERCAPLDARVPPLPLAPPKPRSPRTIGYFLDDGIVSPSAAVRRAVLRAKEVLEDAGLRVVPYEPPLCEEIIMTYLGALSADGGATLRAQVGDDVDESLTLLLKMVRMPARPKRAAGRALSLLGDRLLGGMLEAVREKTVAELWALTARARALTAKVNAAWDHQDLDAVICPPHATPALPHLAGRDFVLSGSASMRFNLLNRPAGVVPVTTVAAGETERERPKGRLEKRAARVDRQSTGLPVGVQIVGRSYQEDVVLDVMALIEAGVRQDAGFPRLAL